MTHEEWYNIISQFQPENSPLAARQNYMLGLTGELGEVCELLKKHHYHGHDLDLEKLKLELGDVYWYVCALSGAPVRPAPNKAGATGPEIALRAANYATEDNLNLSEVTLGLRTLAARYGIEWPEVLAANAQKLSARYPTGKFRQEDSRDRSET